MLEDENVLIDDRFYLIGRQDASEESRAEMSELFKEIDNSKYTIVLDHQPNDYDAEEAVGADMVLSGHTHGGTAYTDNLRWRVDGRERCYIWNRKARRNDIYHKFGHF